MWHVADNFFMEQSCADMGMTEWYCFELQDFDSVGESGFQARLRFQKQPLEIWIWPRTHFYLALLYS